MRIQEKQPKKEETLMKLIPAGSFIMGSDQGSEFEKPLNEIFLDSFWMDETPVTNKQFKLFVNEANYLTDAEKEGKAWGYTNGEFKMITGLNWKTYSEPEREDHPVVLVSWFDAMKYANWAGKELPTEAQWEKAALDGKISSMYPWGIEPPNGSQCNFNNEPTEIPGTKSVYTFEGTTNYKIRDLVGNVWQWCSDYYKDNWYSEMMTKTNPECKIESKYRVRRGGAWNVIQPFRLRCSNRGAFDPHSFAINIGFRCVKNDV